MAMMTMTKSKSSTDSFDTAVCWILLRTGQSSDVVIANLDPPGAGGLRTGSIGSLREEICAMVRTNQGLKAIARGVFTEIGMLRQKIRDDDVQQTADDRPSDRSYDSSSNTEILALTKIDVLNDLRQAIHAEGGHRLRKLLLISISSESTDPRDRVYGLLGLLQAQAQDHDSDADPSATISIDYSKPAAAVYTDAMSHIFHHGQGPYYLSGVYLLGISAIAPHIPDLPPEVEQPRLPSWVPDFSRRIPQRATQPRALLFHPPASLGASGCGADCNNGTRLGDTMTLQVGGLFVDTIQEVIPFGSSWYQFLETLPGLELMASNAKQRSCQFQLSIISLMEQFKCEEPLRALVSNRPYMSSYDAAPLTYEEMYRGLLKRYRAISLDPDYNQQDSSEYALSLKQGLSRKSFFTTQSGFVGTCVPDSCRGDIIAILFGSPAPFVLRSAAAKPRLVEGEERQIHSLIGASYVSGIMNGEMVD